MKNLVILLVLLFSGSILAQESSISLPTIPKFRIGIHAGATGSNVTVDFNNLKDLPKQGWGYQAGLVTQYNLMNWFRFNGNLDFVQKRFVIPDRLPSKQDIKEKLDVLGNMFRFNFDTEFLPFRNFGIHLGPYMSYWQMGKAILTKSGDNIPTQVEEYEIIPATGDVDANDLAQQVMVVNPWDFGITGGLSYDMTPELALDVKYEIGLADLNKLAQDLKGSSLFKFDDSGGHSGTYPSINFRTLSVSLTYWIK